MIITCRRIAAKRTYTIGRLYVDGEYLCDTLEDTDRGLSDKMTLEEIKKIKVKGSTAIPRGAYDLLVTYSPKYAQRYWAKKYDGKLPLLNIVKGFEGVRIHVGNSHRDTEGCPLVGMNTAVGRLTSSAVCFDKLMQKIMKARNKNEKIRYIIV